MLAIFLIVLILAPISLKLFVLYNNVDKKLYFALYLFKNINLLSGYFNKRERGGIYLHLNNKAIILTLKTLDYKSGSGILKAFNLKNAYINVNASANMVNLIALSYNFISILNYSFSGNELSVKTDLNLYFNDSDFYNIGVFINAKSNLLRIILAIISNAIIKGKNNFEKLKN